MDEKYRTSLDAAADAVPDGGCVVALVSTIESDHAAAIASDIAQLVGGGRDGHTLLLSLDAALDHEIGVEPAEGLTEVLGGGTSLARAAAHGRARGFVFVPAGANPADPVALLESTAFRSLTASAAGRGGTVLVFVPGEAWSVAKTEVIEGVIWLGPPPEGRDATARRPSLGSVRPPASPSPAESRSPREDRVRRPTAQRVIATRGAGPRPVQRGTRPAAGDRSRWVLAVLVAVAVLTVVLSVVIASRARRPASFLPQNDSLWLNPPTADEADPP